MSVHGIPGFGLTAAVAALCILSVAPGSASPRLSGPLPGSLGPSRSATEVPIACADLSKLSDLGKSDLQQVTNARTGDTLNYVVIGDGATGSSISHGSVVTDAEVLVLFPGTSGIMPDWPIQMITNSTYSPDIRKTPGYTRDQDGSISLCHDYYLVLFDYPGVGNTNFSGPALTGDQIADDIDAMLDDATDTYGIVTDTVSVGGWSLGTLYALKYAFLSPAADTGRSIDDIVLIASKPGGNIDTVPNGNQASCITTLFNSLIDAGLSQEFRFEIEKSLAKLTFPYEDQPPYNGTDNDDCTATVDTDNESVTVSVTFDCPKKSECRHDIKLQTSNRTKTPWDKTEGVDHSLYQQERNFVADWDYCVCRTAGSDYTSEDCSCATSYTSPNSITNGGVCKTRSKQANTPHSYGCARIDMSGTMTVINGPEDLVIQWLYGREMVRAYNRKYGSGTANHVRFRGRSGAGHSIMVQHPKWMQKQIYKAISDGQPSSRDTTLPGATRP